ncbi:Ribosomal silencing factor rsfs [Thalictrum thalictroides]|uniref:Protein Iojap, chloroplastic n=1 Tax=Thalictrum thalictroides TaxID=46969 RepID=A0A7J6WWB0_THATH|nr:Ribosomal silencing factor rsfs [Thalictrum thalictroides]
MRVLASIQSLNLSSPIPHLLLLPKTNPPQTLVKEHDKNKSRQYSSLLLVSHKSRSLVLRSQKRPQNNMSEDTDEMFDDLFDKYGKVVYKRNDQKPAAAEVDDDAESLSFAVALAKVANEVKADDIRVLFVKPLVYWTRFFIIATAFSRPQVDAIGSKIRDLAEKQFKRVATGDYKPNSWTLLDFGDVVVHIFLPPQRALYNLEEFYANATPIELPFENQNQNQFRR